MIISTIEYASHATTRPTNANMIVLRAFFIFSSSPVERINPIPPQVMAITARILVSRIRKLITAAIALIGVSAIVGSIVFPLGATTSIAVAFFVRIKRKRMLINVFIRFM